MGYPHFPTKTFFMNEQKNIDQGYCLKMIIQNTRDCHEKNDTAQKKYRI